MNLASESLKEKIIHELSQRIVDNVYAYIDIIKNGLHTSFLDVWVECRNDSITAIVLKYYNSFQIYAKNDSEIVSEIVSLIHQYQPQMISGLPDIVKRIYSLCSDQYVYDDGYVLSQSYISIPYPFSPTETRNLSDIEKIAELICSNAEIGAHYTPELLINQFKSRIETGNGRNFVVKIEDKIIAHYATYAEASNIAVMGGLIVSPIYRGRGIARSLHSYLSNLLISENRLPILFCHEEKIKNLYLNLGAKVCSNYGKLLLRTCLNR